jgi:hypothetical protein
MWGSYGGGGCFVLGWPNLYKPSLEHTHKKYLHATFQKYNNIIFILDYSNVLYGPYIIL